MSFLDIPSEQYHADQVADQPTLSASIAALLCKKSPAHAYAAHPRLNPNFQRQDDKHEWDIGTAAHALLLEGRNAVGVVMTDDWRTKDAKAMRDEIRAEGRIPLLGNHWQEVEAMVEAAREQLAVFPEALLTDGMFEATLVWQKNGVDCRSRLDHVRDDYAIVCDYKTSQSADPIWFSERGVYSNDYDVKAAFYLAAVKAVSGVDAEFRWIVQEKKPPYALSVIAPGPDVLELGARKVRYALETWKRCLASGDWPGYPTRTCYAELPAWEDARWMEKTTREGVAV